MFPFQLLCTLAIVSIPELKQLNFPEGLPYGKEWMYETLALPRSQLGLGLYNCLSFLSVGLSHLRLSTRYKGNSFPETVEPRTITAECCKVTTDSSAPLVLCCSGPHIFVKLHTVEWKGLLGSLLYFIFYFHDYIIVTTTNDRNKTWDKVSQQGVALTAKSDDACLIPQIFEVEGENRPPLAIL